MKSKKYIATSLAVILAAVALPVTAFAEERDKQEPVKVTLNEVAHSIFMRRSMLPSKKDILKRKALTLPL